ncbi:MAG: rod-binding protein [Alphaproteobacteria bacterium]
MSGALTPDTSIALLQAAQGDKGASVKALKDAAKNRDTQKVEDTARDFEAVFIAEMMQPMFEGIEVEAPFGGGKGEEIFRSMMLQEYGKIISQTGGIGIAGGVKEQMIQMQEAIDNRGNNGGTHDE